MSSDDGTAAARAIGIIAKPASVKLAQTLGLTAAAFLAGQTAGATFVLLPAILESPAPALLARQFKAATVDSSAVKYVQLPATLLLGSLFAWLASREPAFGTRAFKAYAIAAALYPTTLAYAALVTVPAGRRIADSTEATDGTAPTGASPITKSSMEGQESASTIFVSNSISSSSYGGSVDNDESPTTLSPAGSVRGLAAAAATTTATTPAGDSGHAENRLKKRSNLYEFATAGRATVNDMSTHQLVDRWGWLNLGQAVLATGAAVAAAWAVASEDLSFFELF